MGECSCNSGVRLIYSCSGAADVGEIADRAARQLRREGFAQGSCITGIGAGLSGYIESAKGADINFVIDGCGVACASKIFENIGLKPVSFIVASMGFKKGKTPVTDEVINTVCENIKKAQAGTGTQISEAVEGGCSCGGNC